jgi:hypothetical protein
MPDVEFVVVDAYDAALWQQKKVVLGKMTEYRASQPQNCNFNLD